MRPVPVFRILGMLPVGRLEGLELGNSGERDEQEPLDVQGDF